MSLYITDYQTHSVKCYYWEKSNTRKKFTQYLFKYYSTPFCFVYGDYAHIKSGHLSHYGDQKWPILIKREILQVLKNNYLQDLVVLGTGVEVRSTRANTLMAQTFRSSNKHIICSRNRQLRWVARCWVLYMSRCKSMAKPLWIVIGCCKYICKAIQ